MKDDKLKAMGQRLRNAREAVSMTAREVAERIGVHNQTVIQYELGSRSPLGDLDRFFLLCETVGQTPVSILGIESMDGLTPEEEHIIKAYRATSPQGRQAVIHTLSALRDAS